MRLPIPARLRILLVLTMTVLLAALPSGAQAGQAWPSQPVKLVVPYAAGGPTDTFARVLAQQWGKQLGVSMLVENRTGAGTIVGTDYVAKARPDGYTVLLTTVAHAVNPSIMAHLPYRVIQDFAPVGLAAKAPLVLLVSRQFPARDLNEFLTYVKAHPGAVNYGSAGNGSAPHIAAELLNLRADLKTAHIPYRGTGPAMTDLISGQIAFMLDSAPTGLAQVRAGTVRLLATTMSARLTQTPDTPAIAEAVPGYEAYTWNAAFVPAATPADVIDTLNRTLRAALTDPGLRKRADEMGLVLQSNPTPGALAALLDSEIAKWRGVAQAAHIKEN